MHADLYILDRDNESMKNWQDRENFSLGASACKELLTAFGQESKLLKDKKDLFL